MTTQKRLKAVPGPLVIRNPNTGSPKSSTTESGFSENSPKSDESVKVLFLGSAKVGKTSIIRQFLEGKYDQKYTPTVEDVHNKKFIINNHFVRMDLIDTAGAFDFPAMMRLCIAKADAFVIVFAHDSVYSLDQAGDLLEQIRSQRKEFVPTLSSYVTEKGSNRDEFSIVSVPFLTLPPIVVVCNKSDLPPSCSQVSEQAIMEWLMRKDLKPSQFVYSSAKTNDSIQSIFRSLWVQNDITKAVTFEKWNFRRGSFGTSSSRTPPHNPTTNFSAITSGGVLDVNGDTTTTERQRSRGNFFRSSLKLHRNSSSKSSKKSEIIRLECVIS